MPGFEVKIEGLSELQSRLDELKGPEAKRILNRALLAGAEVFQEAVAERTPVRPELPSGTALPPGAMKNDIRIKRVRAPQQGSDYFAVGPGKYTAHVMRWVEFGHRLVRGGYSKLLASGKTRGPGKHVDDVPAHPVMRPAYEEAQSSALSAIVDSVKEQLANLKNKKGGS